jgi:uncharacterized protein (TIGR02594 family)
MSGPTDFVRWMQERLDALGYQPGPVDGWYGPMTREALRDFQAVHHLPMTGTATRETVHALQATRPLYTPPDVRAGDTIPWYTEAMRHLGLREVPGSGNNPTIMDWADNLDLHYAGDDVPWCGLFTAYAVRSTLPNERLPANVLGARNWLQVGEDCDPVRGSLLVFWRTHRTRSWHGHVGIYHAEDASAYHVLGGNQSDSVSIARIEKGRLLGARWPSTALPLYAESDIVRASATGQLSRDEA